MIDEDRTMQLFGYVSSDLGEYSKKKVVRVCEECGKYQIVTKKGTNELCASCTHLKRKCLPKPKFVSEEDRFIKGTTIDRIKTIEKFGYDPICLTPKSNKKIIAICEGCGLYNTIYKHSWASKVSDEYLCHSCRLKTSETKKKMSIANSKPRGHMPQSQKDNISNALKGRKRSHRSEDWCKNISKGKKGKSTKLKGQLKSPEHKEKISASMQGIPYSEWTGYADDTWKQWHNCTYINEIFPNCHRHHITPTLIVCIPADLHNHIQHNMRTGENMGEINLLAMQYVFGDV